MASYKKPTTVTNFKQPDIRQLQPSEENLIEERETSTPQKKWTNSATGGKNIVEIMSAMLD